MPCDDGIDPRMPRFGQSLTGTLLAAALVLREPLIVAGVAVVLAGAALGGRRWSLWAHLYRAAVAPFLSPPHELEDPRGPRFAKQLGFVFTSVATASLVSTVAPLVLLGWVLTGLVSALALLAAVTGFCVACHFYGLYARLNRGTAVQG